MTLKNFLKFALNPRKYIKKKIEIGVDKKLRKLGFFPINETKEEDIFIVAFPKSGITWTQSLISGIQYGIDTNFLPDKLVQEIVPDIYFQAYYKRFGDIKFFKSHELPKPEYKKVIYLVRDGRDAMVSYFHFNQKIGVDVTLEEMIKENKGVYPALWYVHVRKWIENPYNAEILYIKYEDLLQNTEEVLKKICDFVGFQRDMGLLKKVAEGSTIDKMRSRARKYGGMAHPNWQGEKGKEFFRKGKIASFKEEMPENLQKIFAEKAIDELKYFNYEV